MPINRITPPSDIDRAVEQYAANIRRAIIYKMQYVGERCIIDARTSANFTDRTGNLRSSIGYVIVEDGKVVFKGGFEVVKQGNDGAAQGQKFIRQVVAEFPRDIVLVVCAGMKYAAYVAARGFNVTDSAETLALRLVPQIRKDLGLT